MSNLNNPDLYNFHHLFFFRLKAFCECMFGVFSKFFFFKTQIQNEIRIGGCGASNTEVIHSFKNYIKKILIVCLQNRVVFVLVVIREL